MDVSKFKGRKVQFRKGLKPAVKKKTKNTMILKYTVDPIYHGPRGPKSAIAI